MKKIIISLIVLIAIALTYFIIFGEENSSVVQVESADSANQTIANLDSFKTKLVKQDSLKTILVKQDSLITELSSNVATLTKKLDALKTENKELSEKVEKIDNPKGIGIYISIGAFVLGLIAFIISLLKPKGIKEERVKDIIKREFDKFLSKSVSKQQQINKASITSSSDRKDYDKRIRQLEEQMNKAASSINYLNSLVQNLTAQNSTNQNPIAKEPEYQRVGYAKIDTGSYFTEIYDSYHEGCVFKISFTDCTKGKFNIISLDKLQSRNDWQQKVECTGISIKEASGFHVVNDGICEKIDEHTWEVKKPLKIQLIK